jgi:hypothetical protein
VDMTLVALTGASLVVAVAFAVVAWRLARDERTRARARVAALAAGADADDAGVGRAFTARQDDAPDHAPSIAADPSRDVHKRGSSGWTFPARVTPLAAAGRAQVRAQELALRQETAVDILEGRQNAAPRGATIADSFLRGGDPVAPADHRQRGLAIAAGVLLVVLVSGGAWLVTGSRAPQASSGASLTAAPVELLSLRHEWQGTKLAVFGLVRNPVAGQRIAHLSAVVLLFDQAGVFVTSGQTPIDFLDLAPGDESPFVIQVDAPATVTRYRVSFRTERGVMPHVDRRGQSPVAPASFEPTASARAGR